MAISPAIATAGYQAFAARSAATSTPNGGQQACQNGRRDHGPGSPSVQVLVTGLPQGVTTLDIYNNFKTYGNISRINILDNRNDDRSYRAEVLFESSSQHTLWERHVVCFTSNGRSTSVRVALSQRQPRKFFVESLVRPGVIYPEKIELVGTTLDFGVMMNPHRVLRMASRGNPDGQPRLVLNLKRREIEVFFPSRFESDSRKAIRNFRFSIALDDNLSIRHISNRQYILQPSGIPWYSKQLKEAIHQTHAQDGKRWSEEDTWARQTDIVDHKVNVQQINQTAVSLEKNLNCINIARWRTFQFTLLKTRENLNSETVFRNALKDFNVEVTEDNDLKTVDAHPRLEKSTWNTIRGTGSTSTFQTLAEELFDRGLSFAVRYQLEVCISHGWLNEYAITKEFMQRLASIDDETAINKLVLLDSAGKSGLRIWNPMDVFTDFRFRKPAPFKKIPENCMETHSATVTAAGILFHTPTVEVTNRVIRRHRQHRDRFLRVRFEDDMYRGQTKLYATLNKKMGLLFYRVKRVLRHGIKLGDVHYEFLAWGNSQLREHGAYFFAKTGSVSASSIRAEMGAFDEEKVVAKRAARMGQCFSTTTPVHLRIPTVTKANTIPDIKHNGYVFTDGVGKISMFAAQMVHQQLNIKGPVPSCYQFRLGGCKGVLVVWPELHGIDVRVRGSQFKFNSPSGELEIIRWSEFWQPFLNRQLILCLSSLGVADRIFTRKQDEAIKALEAAMCDDTAALRALRDNVDPNGMTVSMCELVNGGFRSSKEPFVTSILHLWRAWSLKYLKEKAKIPVPKGAFVLGCADETNTLRGHSSSPYDEGVTQDLPEIFIQIKNPQTGRREVIKGVCILARNPSLHPGDIRVVNAVDVPNLAHLCDVVVMPTQGARDLASMCSGGDLDGDDYIVIWDQELIPKVWNVEPFHYEPPAARMATNEITTDDIINFFYDYLQNDFLGRIAHAHMAAADFLDEGLDSQTCLELVQLHSMAVDYPKTGVPAIMPRRLERNEWPHFMEKKARPYKSRKILGQLYDAVERVAFVPNYDLPFDMRILSACKPTQPLIESIKLLKHDYDNSLQRIMAQHNIRTEFEVWSTFVLDHSKASRDYKFHEEIGQISSTLKKQYRTALVDLAGGDEYQLLVPVAVAAYHYTYGQVQTGLREIREGQRYEGPEGMPFMSFPWLLQDTLCQIAKTSNGILSKTSVAIVENGVLSHQDPTIQFDKHGRAEIEIADDPDRQCTVNTFSAHLPDPYRSDGRPMNKDEEDLFRGIELLGSESGFKDVIAGTDLQNSNLEDDIAQQAQNTGEGCAGEHITRTARDDVTAVAGQYHITNNVLAKCNSSRRLICYEEQSPPIMAPEILDSASEAGSHIIDVKADSDHDLQPEDNRAACGHEHNNKPAEKDSGTGVRDRVCPLVKLPTNNGHDKAINKDSRDLTGNCLVNSEKYEVHELSSCQKPRTKSDLINSWLRTLEPAEVESHDQKIRPATASTTKSFVNNGCGNSKEDIKAQVAMLVKEPAITQDELPDKNPVAPDMATAEAVHRSDANNNPEFLKPQPSPDLRPPQFTGTTINTPAANDQSNPTAAESSQASNASIQPTATGMITGPEVPQPGVDSSIHGVLGDPKYMTDEQIRALGFSTDMEL